MRFYILVIMIFFSVPVIASEKNDDENTPIQISNELLQTLINDANNGSAKAAYDLGEIYVSQKNYSEAEKWLRFSWFKDEAKAALLLYDLASKNHIEFKDAEQTKKIALNSLYQKAEQGQGSAALDLGHFYLYGEFIEGDYQKAYDYFKIADRANKPMASYRLGMSYIEGLYHPINSRMAMHYFERASMGGVGRASRQLAIAYHLGIGKPKDINKAITYYEKAVDEGEALAMRDLANIYGDEIKDPQKREVWLLKAADQDISDAHYMLGELYKTSNPVKSTKHFKAAAAMKHHLSRIEIDENY